MDKKEISDWSIRLGLAMARVAFAKRGNHSEMHLREDELAAMLAAALEFGLDHAQGTRSS